MKSKRNWLLKIIPPRWFLFHLHKHNRAHHKLETEQPLEIKEVFLQAHHRVQKLPRVQVELSAHLEDQDSEIWVKFMSKKLIIIMVWTVYFLLLFHVDDPIHFEDVVKEEKWIESMNEEIGAIEKNDTWELVDLPQGKEFIGVKWVYKTKINVEGKI